MDFIHCDKIPSNIAIDLQSLSKKEDHPLTKLCSARDGFTLFYLGMIITIVKYAIPNKAGTKGVKQDNRLVQLLHVLYKVTKLY